MKKLSTFCFLLLIVLTSMAQRRKTVFLEVLGNGLKASGNFDLRLKPDQNDGLGLRAGVGGGSFSGYDDQGNSASIGIITFPLAVNYLVGKKRSSFESGIGITPMYVTASGTVNDNIFSGSGLTVTGFLNAGYRYQPLNNGLMLHLKWTPAFNSSGFSPQWFGLGIGYSFK
ncbi:hypothetical protein [Daejeonella sp.]|uniref:hypothetical protein n=1 Tax=Daejeonella sp. TaxID=2805397 RepID=UPI0030BC3C7C